MITSIIQYYHYQDVKLAKEMEKQLEAEKEAIGYYTTIIHTEDVHVIKAQLLEVQDKITNWLNEFSGLQYVHVYPANNKINYEFTYYGLNVESLKLSLEDIGVFLTYIDDTISSFWKDVNPDVNIVVIFVSYKDYEEVLMISEDSNLLYTALDKQEKEGTKQDWIDWFFWEKGYEPTEDELTKFKNKKNRAIGTNGL